MEKILNYRKLADGKTNEDGKQIKNIYRSADVSRGSESDCNTLATDGIKAIIDLRSKDERSKHPLLNDERFELKHNNIIDEDKQNHIADFSVAEASNMMCNLYQHTFVDTEGFKNELEYILGLNGDGFLFHCTAGKDRTGITGVILMHILGFSEEDIREEYLKIDPLLVQSISKMMEAQIKEMGIEIDTEALFDFAIVKDEFLNSFFIGVTDKYGTLDNYIEDKLKINAEQILILKQNYLV